MVFLFRNKSIINIFYLVILSLAVHFHFFTQSPIVVFNNEDGIFSTLLATYIAGLSSTVLFILYHAVIIGQAIRLNLVLNDFRMFQQNNFTTAMAYILLTGLLPQWTVISSALLANFLLIWLFIKLCRLYNNPSPKSLLFNTGLIVGGSVLCYHPTAILILVVLFALAVVRPFRLAEWVVLLMGILLPYYFLFSWLFLNNQLKTVPDFLPSLNWNLPVKTLTIPLMVSLGIVSIYILAGLYYWQVSSSRMIIQIRKNWGVMIVMLLILLPIPFLFRHAGFESAAMVLIPMATFAGNVFSYPKRLIFPNILFWLSMAMMVYNNL